MLQGDNKPHSSDFRKLNFTALFTIQFQVTYSDYTNLVHDETKVGKMPQHNYCQLYQLPRISIHTNINFQKDIKIHRTEGRWEFHYHQSQ